jgi:diamine N-acetyltransferase
MDKIDFLSVKTKEQIAEVEALASNIWHEHYISIIGIAQVEYMLKKFQSAEAIGKQLKEGYFYYLVKANKKYTGYMGFEINEEELFLSKIYIKSENRGKGYGKASFDFIKAMAKKRNCKKIVLTVNKNNLNSIKAYKKMGFINKAPIVQDIGGGFVMDDYIMEKNI